MSSKVLAHGVRIAQKEMIIPKHRQHANSIERCNLKRLIGKSCFDYVQINLSHIDIPIFQIQSLILQSILYNFLNTKFSSKVFYITFTTNAITLYSRIHSIVGHGYGRIRSNR